MPRRVSLDPIATSVPIRTADHARWGVTRARLRSPDVAHPFVGVNVVAPVLDDVVSRAMAFQPLLNPRDAFSHTTAAVLLGAPLPPEFERDRRLHVVAVGGTYRTVRPDVVGHRAQSLEVVSMRGMPVVAAADCWFQLAGMLDPVDLIAVGDYFITGPRSRSGIRSPATTIEELQRVCGIRAGRRGARRAALTLPCVRVGPDSRSETLLRLLLVDAGLPEPEIARPVAIAGRLLHPDLSWPDWMIAFEYEGDGHRTDRTQWRHDISRREDFEAEGWRIIRVTADDLRPRSRARFLARVERVIRLCREERG